MPKHPIYLDRYMRKVHIQLAPFRDPLLLLASDELRKHNRLDRQL